MTVVLSSAYDYCPTPSTYDCCPILCKWLLPTVHCTGLLPYPLSMPAVPFSLHMTEWDILWMTTVPSSILPSPSDVHPFPKIKLVLWRHHHEKKISSNGKVTAFTGCVPNRATLKGTAWDGYKKCSHIQKRHSSKMCSSHLKNVSPLFLFIVLILTMLAHPSHRRIQRWWYPSHGSPSSVQRWTSPFQAVVFQVASCPWWGLVGMGWWSEQGLLQRAEGSSLRQPPDLVQAATQYVTLTTRSKTVSHKVGTLLWW